ncbi:unnamed protein product [Parnassius mnemosyne]|uniref:Chitin-binding type-2 domain-containing protein n=1 Tax=Parnassius mnemosyne TaxID=213953 RepID=A0AAV1KCY6_9NEOP
MAKERWLYRVCRDIFIKLNEIETNLALSRLGILRQSVIEFKSINKQVCDWRAHVDCEDRIIVEDLKPDDEESEEVERPVFPIIEFLPNGCPVNHEIHWLLPHEKSCSLFCYCVQVLSIILLTIAAAANSENLCPKIQDIDSNIELLLPHRDCYKFYQCVHGQPVEMSCPNELYFSINEQACNWRADVDCGDRTTLEDSKPVDGKSEEVETSPESDKDEDEKEPEETVQTERPVFPIIEFLPNGCPVNREIHWLLPHETSCSLFYYCVQGEREVRRCPFWLHFNRKLQICDWPRNAGCIEIAE